MVIGGIVDSESKFLIPVLLLAVIESENGSNQYHRGVWPPLLSVSVFLASFPSLAAQYGSCFPIVLRFGRFFALSTMTTNVPISGPSTVISAYIPAV